MTDAPTRDARHPQPVPIDLSDIETAHTDPESPEHLLSTAVAETAAAVTGVHHLGGALSRSLDRASRRILGSSTVPGVTVSQSEGTTVVDLDLVVEYPHTITTVVEQVRSQVRHAAAQLSNEPIEVNVNVTDVHGPFDRVVPANEEIDPAESVAARASATADDVSAKVADTASATAAALSGAASTAAGAVSSATDTVRERAADVVQAAGDAVSDAARQGADETVAHGTADASAAPVAPASSDESAELHPLYLVPVIIEVEPADGSTGGPTDEASDGSADDAADETLNSPANDAAATGTTDTSDEHRS